MTSANTTQTKAEDSGLWEMSSELTDAILVVNTCVINVVIGTFGVASNIITMIVFFKQGFHETINISLFGLAVSDLGCLLATLWLGLLFNPLFQRASLPFVPIELENTTGGWPHTCFLRTTSLIMAFVTLERCLCIALPLQIRIIITPRRTVCVIVVIFLLLFISTIPVYTVNLLEWKFYPRQNKTLLGITYTDQRDYVEQIAFALNNAYGYFSFLAVIVATCILVTKLNSKGKWRKEMTAAKNTKSTSARDRTVVKMVVVISTIFILCYLPKTVIFAVTMINREFGSLGRYSNLFYTLCSFSIGLETINASVNIFIYLTMSSKYKAIFWRMFSGFVKSRDTT